MHKEILSKEQVQSLSLVKAFKKDFYLVGGTAIALHLGHRQSIDFDLFANQSFDNLKIRRKIKRRQRFFRTIRDETGQFTLSVDSVKMTFFHYPFSVEASESFEDIIGLPDLLTLGAMKAYALGRRPKWKDYVDLYFIFKRRKINKVIKKAEEIFGAEFNEKLLRSQLVYFQDIDYSEKIIYLPGFETPDEEIKKALVEASLEVY
ncbi:MAG: hypothetical protein CEN89_285 [Candidatus Berkelbacteria bacterium Licking1014_7]|uniref:Nucleotidyl transferase AbiEii toxin, Type IV TA system n=1 Tax=Candidatus Berkelbacteria bacterium Licking1014_7 TaxID=2017147 RepID=A0A554LJI7_9BACT|nr:MAG: hypothetical protein CEN89_285 [Candidatus Berkelbacteria bacterium Licking1014_7]